MQEYNKEILIYLNSLINNTIIEKIVLIFSDLPIFFLPLFLVYMWLYFTYKEKNDEKKNNLLLIFYSTSIAIIFNLILQQFIHMNRPETALEWVWKLILNHIPDASFPSDHATVSASFIIALFLAGYKKTWAIFIIPVILMNFSRVALGVHWPFDIVWWLIVWTISSLFVFKYLKTNKVIIKVNNFIIKTMKYIKM